MKYYLLIIVSSLFTLDTTAQCAMCRAVLETEDGGITGEAVNDGILYLMIIPYILVAAIGYAIYKMRKNKSAKLFGD